MPAFRLSALSIAPAAHDWLLFSIRPRWLHVFAHVCNLTNERGDVFSVVSRDIGDGPFNLVIEQDGIIFSNFLNVQSQIIITPSRMVLGGIVIDAQGAALASLRPDWGALHSHKDPVVQQLMSLPVVGYLPCVPDSLLSDLFNSVYAADIQAARVAARKLAGLGPGLTPAGDDVLLGAVFAAWIIHPPATAAALAEAITNTAAPLTTSLSAAWLRSAGKGDAGILWHRLFDALLSADDRTVQKALEGILAVGDSSGAAALAGFIGSLTRLPSTYVVPEYAR